ncbi:hypothetical protein TNCV_1396891 [Trichonephila clavipes]|nr:hypothetical protein TNCV_1396891 [Trichonephila clavipes]
MGGKRLVVLYVSSHGRNIRFPNFRHGQLAMTVNRYTNTELADIHFIYDLASRNGCLSARLYVGRYPTRRQPNHQTFTRVHQNLAEHGFFRATTDDTPANSEMNLGT